MKLCNNSESVISMVRKRANMIKQACRNW